MSTDPEVLIDIITRKVMEHLEQSEAVTSRAPAKAVAANPEPVLPVHPRGGEDGDADADTRERMKLFHVSGARNPEETRALAEAGAARVVATVGYCPASDGLASLIDHTLLKPDATREDVERLCREAAQYCFASVCVNPNWVPLCRDLLRGSGVKVCTVIGFPSARISSTSSPTRRGAPSSRAPRRWTW